MKNMRKERDIYKHAQINIFIKISPFIIMIKEKITHILHSYKDRTFSTMSTYQKVNNSLFVYL